MQNNIKQNNKNQMTTTHLDSVMRVTIEELTKNFELFCRKLYLCGRIQESFDYGLLIMTNILQEK